MPAFIDDLVRNPISSSEKNEVGVYAPSGIHAHSECDL